MAYAENTSVSVEKSKAEIEKTLQRYGADQFMHGWTNYQAMVSFQMYDRHIKFLLTLPDRKDERFQKTPTGKKRTALQIEKEYEQACRQRWRALNLVIKAKLEAVEAGISEFEDEFMANIALPDGSTVGQFMRPQIARAYETHNMPQLLPFLDQSK